MNRILLRAAVLVFVWVPGTVLASEALAPLERVAALAATVQDYTLVMKREQRFEKPGDEMEHATLFVKHRREPSCVYMRWIEKPHKGREMLFCDERYDGKILVHEGGLLGVLTIKIDPKKESKDRGVGFRSPDEIGMFAIERMVEDAKQRESEPTLSQRKINGVEASCLRFETGAEVPRRFEVGARELCVDPANNLPLAIRLWSPDGTLMEDGTFSQIKLNPGLSDQDFDKENPDYDF